MIGPEHLEEPVAVEATPSEAVLPRRFRIMTDISAAYGYSAGCAGCRHKRSGFTGVMDQEENCRSHSRRKRFQIQGQCVTCRGSIRSQQESQDAVVLADEPERVEEDGRRTPVLAERAPEEEEEAVLDALEDNPEGGSLVDIVFLHSSPRTTPVAEEWSGACGRTGTGSTHGLGFPVATP